MFYNFMFYQTYCTLYFIIFTYNKTYILYLGPAYFIWKQICFRVGCKVHINILEKNSKFQRSMFAMGVLSIQPLG